MARIEYADPENLSPENRPLLDTLSETDDEPAVDHRLEGGTLNVYRTLGRNVELLEAFREYGSAVWHEGGLSARQREFVILATAYHADSAYEWQQHVRVALNEGVTPAEIVAISREEPDRLEPELAALVEYIAAFVDGTVDDADHAALTDHYDEATAVGIAMLAGCYLGLARVLRAFEVELESPFVGWELEDL
ncbi:Carboxymuconolactone decarboxylase family protein [Halobiforma haloterrestris]|uniref:Carboxymuconolactone decarboxylase family protein n=1 Tax=Natronobacterium haloterrestre TaxID=148448 RepID=A0A1I1CWR6_NATHA|nr:carboxymuconolactone decarboxylase family protein [Halobiforma haloterrestris]SFB67159.1 Carboxymuconolactone decarboxylase family protein [Halobiforma haloterrestris]